MKVKLPFNETKNIVANALNIYINKSKNENEAVFKAKFSRKNSLKY